MRWSIFDAVITASYELVFLPVIQVGFDIVESFDESDRGAVVLGIRVQNN